MMNKMLPAVLLICFQFHGFAQRREDANYVFWPYNQYTEKIDFSEVINFPEANTDSLYSAARAFARTTFTGNRDTIYHDDSSRRIICKSAYYIPVEELGERGKGFISFTLSIQCRYNYYKYSLTNLQHFAFDSISVAGGPLENEKTASGGMLFPRTYWERQKTKCYYLIQATIHQLKQAMNKVAES